jgi:hypothetical protein
MQAIKKYYDIDYRVQTPCCPASYYTAKEGGLSRTTPDLLEKKAKKSKKYLLTAGVFCDTVFMTSLSSMGRPITIVETCQARCPFPAQALFSSIRSGQVAGHAAPFLCAGFCNAEVPAVCRCGLVGCLTEGFIEQHKEMRK